MYSLIKERSYRDLAYRQMPEITLAMLIAEIFYKFRSFTLEALAFGATWFLIDLVVEQLVRLWPRPDHTTLAENER